MPLYNNDHGNLEGKSDDDHTQYPLLAGRAGGQTLYGGTASTDDLVIAGSNAAWDPSTPHQVRIPNSRIKFTGQTTTEANIVGSLIHFNETITHNQAAAAVVGFVYEPTINYAQNQTLSVFPAFYANPTYQLTAGGVTHGEYNLMTGFLSRAKWSVNHSGATSTILEHSNYLSQPWLTQEGTATATITTFANYIANQRILFSNHVDSGITVTDFVGFLVKNPFNGGTITNNIGLDIRLLTTGTNNIGIRNASTTVNTPATAQNITAATQAITVASTTKQLTANASYTLTSAPTIADGQDGQVVKIINVDTADTITLQDQGTLANSNLRLTANTVALAPRQSIELTYSATVGDWVQTSNLVAVL